MTTYADEILTRVTIERILTRYFVDGDRSPDIVTLQKPRCEVDRNVAGIILERSELSEEDLSVFGHFIGDSLTILDVGANFGYSATSIWAAGSNASIVSFEPIGDLEPVLSEISRVVNRKNRSLRGADSKKYEFHIIGISDTVGELKFVTPVINGLALSALTTANVIPNIHCLASDIIEYVDLYMDNQTAKACKLYSFMSPVTTIDKWISARLSKINPWVSARLSKVNLRKVVAIKIDTEGFEGNVLVGAANLLKEQQPLIMAERGHINHRARSTAQEHGYVLAAREGSRLTVVDDYPDRVNAFFVHPHHFEYYRRIGLMVASRP